jgi:DNA-binding IclR family transcriptional regulator
LRERGYVTVCGLWSPHINGLAVPLWSPQYQTYVVVTIGLLSNLYDEMRLHRDVAPKMLELSLSIRAMLEDGESALFAQRATGGPH